MAARPDLGRCAGQRRAGAGPLVGLHQRRHAKAAAAATVAELQGLEIDPHPMLINVCTRHVDDSPVDDSPVVHLASAHEYEPAQRPSTPSPVRVRCRTRALPWRRKTPKPGPATSGPAPWRKPPAAGSGRRSKAGWPPSDTGPGTGSWRPLCRPSPTSASTWRPCGHTQRGAHAAWCSRSAQTAGGLGGRLAGAGVRCEVCNSILRVHGISQVMVAKAACVVPSAVAKLQTRQGFIDPLPPLAATFAQPARLIKRRRSRSIADSASVLSCAICWAET
jgi:hypothetical protein